MELEKCNPLYFYQDGLYYLQMLTVCKIYRLCKFRLQMQAKVTLLKNFNNSP